MKQRKNKKLKRGEPKNSENNEEESRLKKIKKELTS